LLQNGILHLYLTLLSANVEYTPNEADVNCSRCGASCRKNS